MRLPPESLPRRARLLPLLFAAHERDGYLQHETVAACARDARIPLAEAWEAATSYPLFRFDRPANDRRVCTGLSCTLAGARTGPGDEAMDCQFRCYAAPVAGVDEPFDEAFVRIAGPLLAPDIGDWRGYERALALGPGASLSELQRANLRGRGGAYFPVARKWNNALVHERPLALVVNAEEGEPGVFKDRALLCLRPRRVLEGVAIAAAILRPSVVVILVNGEATAAHASLESALEEFGLPGSPEPWVVSGGGGYVLGEETTLLNALEGRKPVPRLRPPYPVDAGLFGMPTVVNNVETLANLSVIFRDGADAFRDSGAPEAPGTKIFSVSGDVLAPGVYELPLGTRLADLLERAGAPGNGAPAAALCGGPSGGFLPPAEFGWPLLPGPLHPTGAFAGAGGIVVIAREADIPGAAMAMAEFNAHESCGKCTPCREGTPRIVTLLRENQHGDLGDLLDVVGAASLCGLGQMAPGPVRSALYFWPELFS